jgi:MFS family permease
VTNEEGASANVSLARVLGIAAAAALVPLNSTMIAVALPAISDDFDVSTAQVSLLITSYLLVMLVGQPIAGRVADAVGSRRTVSFALVGLALFSAFAAVAGSFGALLVARGLQAVCAAALGPSSQSLLRTLAPPDRQGRVFGILGSTLGVGAAAGPVIGGVLIQWFDWRSIFVINVPIALLAIVATRSGGQPTPERTRHVAAPGSESGRILNPVFASGFFAQALTTQAQYALLILTPIVLDARGWGAGSIGAVLSALTVGMIVMGPIGGQFGDAHGRRLPARLGITAAMAGIIVLAIAGRSVQPLLLVAGLALFGLGLGATTPNLMSAALGSVPDSRTGAAAGVFTTSRYVGSLTTTLLIAAFVTADATGSRLILTISAVCVVLAFIVVRWLPGPDRREPGDT